VLKEIIKKSVCERKRRDPKELFLRHVKIISGEKSCHNWIGCLDGCGYGVMWFQGRPRRANRIAWILAFGSIPDKLQVLHRCDNPACVRLDHLFLGTHQDNMADKCAKGRYKNGRGELTTLAIAKAIREDYKIAVRNPGGITQRQLAKKYGLHFTTVWQIIHNKIYKQNYEKKSIEDFPGQSKAKEAGH
jgi:hypothetical protein